MAQDQTMQMPAATVKAGGPGGAPYQQKAQQVSREVANMGVLREVNRNLQDPAKRAALERFLKTLEPAGEQQAQ